MAVSLLFLPIVWILIASGRQVAAWLRLPEEASPLDRTLIGFAFGVGILAYAMLLVGLAGFLYPLVSDSLLLILLAMGGKQCRVMAREVRLWLAQAFPKTPGNYLPATLFVFFGLVALSGVYAPPTLIEWDSIAYHLADPKIYIQAHRIIFLPWEDHSNFAFNLEMCYAFGLLLMSVPLAKLFHFACAVGMILASYRLGALLINPRVGLWTALLLTVTPMVFWEAGTAYVDLGLTFYITLTLLALAHGVRARDERWISISAVLMGLTLSTKDTALGVFGLLALGLLTWRLVDGQKGQSIAKTALWCVTALVSGCPWYVKSWMYTHNPVYPLFYSILGGRYWNAGDAAASDAWNVGFGAGHNLPSLLIVPWNLTMALLDGHRPLNPSALPLPMHWHFNDYPAPFMTLSPVLLAAVFVPAFLPGRIPRAVKILAIYALFTLLLWFVTEQHVRYLVPVLPVLCLLTTWAIDRAFVAKMFAGKALAGLSVGSVVFSLFLGALLLARQVPVDLGLASRDNFIAHGDAAYPAIQFINKLPPGTKVVFYGNPLGFYCDKPYLWGESGHSTLIPYAAFHSSEDLRRGLQNLGVTHVLINTLYFPLNSNSGGYSAYVYQLTEGAGPPLYGDPSDPRQHVFVYALHPE